MDCAECVAKNARLSGWLHHAERELAGYGTAEYDAALREMYLNAEAVLAVNPTIAAHVAPYARVVKVVPSGFDPDRFPWPWPQENRAAGPIRLIFAGLTEEYMKGFHVLVDACRQLWSRRQDFELVVTATAPAGERLPFAQYLGWQSQPGGS